MAAGLIISYEHLVIKSQFHCYSNGLPPGLYIYIKVISGDRIGYPEKDSQIIPEILQDNAKKSGSVR